MVTLEKMVFSRSKEKFGICAVSVATFLFGISVRGDWFLIIANLWKIYHHDKDTEIPDLVHPNRAASNRSILGRFYMQNLPFFLVFSVVVSYLTFFGMAGYLHHHFYKRKRDQANEWKCQPDKFLTAENERHAFVMGGINMTIGAIYSGSLSCYIVNGGPTMLYYRILDYGLSYLLASTIVFFLFTDGIAYYVHKAGHLPWFYRNIHKWHHRYQQPIVYTAVAMHPLEFITFQFVLVVPIFVVPVHALIFLTVVLYNYYYGIIDHSGIKMDAVWPWQPSSTFHDNHHKYFHCNFGFNTKIFDWYHGTLHKSDRRYGEDIFGGKGAPLKEKL